MTGRALSVAFAFALLGWTTLAFTATNTVPVTSLGRSAQATGANDVKPAACSALTLSTVVNASGTYTAPNGVNGLLLGGAGLDRITGRSGNECILGGGGDDVLNGGAGTDVCIGGPGIDTFLNCETQIQ